MRTRFIAGVISLFMVALVIIGPVYLSEKLEKIETSLSGLVSSSSIISNMDTNSTVNYTYTPYLETNEDNRINCYITQLVNYYYSYIIRDGGNYEATFPFIEYNVNGYLDTIYTTYSADNNMNFYIFIKVLADDLLNDNANELYLKFDSDTSLEIEIKSVSWALKSGERQGVFINSGGLSNRVENTIHSGGVWEETITLTTQELTDGASFHTDTSNSGLEIGFKLSGPYTGGHVCYFDYQINPEYFEEAEYTNITTWDNQSIINYEPYIQSITPYAVHKVMMGIGAFFIGIAGWIASPWNRYLDGLLPINTHPKRRK